MKILSSQATFFQALPARFKEIYPAVELADVLDNEASCGSKTILVGEGKSACELIQLHQQRQCSHLVQFNPNFFLKDIETTALLIDRPEMYFRGQAQVLVKESLKRCEIDFMPQNNKAEIFDQIDQFLADIKPQNAKESVLAIAQELYMNAILDAPRVSAQKKVQSDHPYTRGEKAKLTLVQSEDRLAVSCADPYGSLNLQHFVARLNEVYQQGPGQVMNMKPGQGAGIGCMIMFENCDRLFLGVIPDKLTVVSCVVPLGLSNRQRAEIKKSLHLVTI